ncbi:MAG: gliding motility-associated C-terminal domain-containing protein, partial [Sphingobacteriales bacterium]
ISPNGDGKNDVFDLTLHKVAALHIFNRYGLEVFSQANYTTQWYGQSSKGDTLPDGTYFYSMQKDNGINVTGWVYVNRQNR